MLRKEFHPPHFYEDNRAYFLTARIAGGRPLLERPSSRDLVRDVLRAAVPDYGIRLRAWVILPDHYHLLLETTDVSPIHRFVGRLHGESAIRLNKDDGTPGRKVWYQYWDRCPRNEHEFWAYFNYIHINPVKHGHLRLPAGIHAPTEERGCLPDVLRPDVLDCLSQYAHSSYPYYLRIYGPESLSDIWARYPIPDYLEVDEM